MPVKLEIQYVFESDGLPSSELFQRWAQAVLGQNSSAELVIRIVDIEEIAALNQTYRKINGPTNILSFPFEAPPYVESHHLGDLVICAPVVTEEAHQQGKMERSHWAHMVIHGILHLQGYDHQTKHEAVHMERLETQIMAQLGYPDPYQ